MLAISALKVLLPVSGVTLASLYPIHDAPALLAILEFHIKTTSSPRTIAVLTDRVYLTFQGEKRRMNNGHVRNRTITDPSYRKITLCRTFDRLSLASDRVCVSIHDLLTTSAYLYPVPLVDVSRRVSHGSPSVSAVFVPVSGVRRLFRADAVVLLSPPMTFALLPAPFVDLGLFFVLQCFSPRPARALFWKHEALFSASL